MKFTNAKFAEYTELNSGGDTYEFQPDKLYQLPLSIAENLAQHGDADVSYEGAYDVDEGEVADRWGQPKEGEIEREEGEATDIGTWLGDRTVSEVEEDVGDLSDEALENGLEIADRKGATKAIEEELEQR